MHVNEACKVTLGTTLFSQQSYDAAAKPLFFSTFALNLISKSIFDNKNPAIVQKSNNYIQFPSSPKSMNMKCNYHDKSKWVASLTSFFLFLDFDL